MCQSISTLNDKDQRYFPCTSPDETYEFSREEEEELVSQQLGFNALSTAEGHFRTKEEEQQQKHKQNKKGQEDKDYDGQ